MSLSHLLAKANKSAPFRVVGISVASDRIIVAFPGWDDSIALREAPLPGEVRGVPTGADAIKAALEHCLEHAPYVIQACVLTMPFESVFLASVDLPPVDDTSDTNEMMRLLTETEIPLASTQYFAGYNISNIGGRNRATIAAIPQSELLQSLKALEELHIPVLAVEYHLHSLARLLPSSHKPVQCAISTNSNVSLCGIYSNHVTSLFPIPKKEIGDVEVASNLLDRFADSLEVDFGEHPNLNDVVSTAKNELNKKHQDNPSDIESLAAISASKRISPSGIDSDTFTFLPFESVTLLTHQQTLTQWSNIRTLLYIPAGILIAANVLTLWLLDRYDQKINTQLTRAIRITPGTMQAMNEIAQYNTMTSSITALGAKEHSMRTTIADIWAAIPQGVTITNIEVEQRSGRASLTGIADTRATYVAFRETLASNPHITDIRFPIQHTGIHEEIPFIMTFNNR